MRSQVPPPTLTAWSLRKRLPVTFVSGQATVNFTGTDILRGGDINDSNSININDYSIMKAKWLQQVAEYPTSAIADINGDGVVNSTDYDIMKANWFAVGDLQ